MNNLSNWKMRLIKSMAGDEPILLNWGISASAVKDGCVAVLIPFTGEKLSLEESRKAVLVPSKNIA